MIFFGKAGGARLFWLVRIPTIKTLKIVRIPTIKNKGKSEIGSTLFRGVIGFARWLRIPTIEKYHRSHTYHKKTDGVRIPTIKNAGNMRIPTIEKVKICAYLPF